MIYLAGLGGFIAGFFIGQYILLYLLKGRSTAEILDSRQIKWTYGLLNWVLAVIGAYAGVMVYKLHLL